MREVFLGVVRDVQDDVRSGRVLVDVLKREVGRTVAAPLHSLAAFALAERDDVHAVGHHEGRVEPQPKVTNDGLLRVGVLVLLQEVGGTGEGDLVDILVDLLRGHANAIVADGHGACRFVEQNFHFWGVGDFAHLAEGGEHLPLLGGIHRIGDEFTQEDFLVAVQELLDDRKDVVGRDVDRALLCHGFRGLGLSQIEKDALHFERRLPQLNSHATASWAHLG